MTLKPGGIFAWRCCATILLPSLIQPRSIWLPPWKKSATRLAASDPGKNFVVGVFERGKLAGTAGFFRRQNNKESHKGHIWGVYVSPELRGKGAGKALMEEIIRRAKEIAGVEQITLVASARLPAQKLYKSVGFETYGTEPHSLKIGTEYVDDVLMVLWL